MVETHKPSRDAGRGTRDDADDMEVPQRSVLLAVGAISGAALAYEILLIRLFSITDWHHFTFLVISLALLGYGASGTVLALAERFLLRHAHNAAAVAAAAFGFSSVAAFLLSQRIDFNSLEIAWSKREAATLILLYLVFAVPFLCAAIAIGLTLRRFGDHAGTVYFADLLGGGSSSAATILLLFVVHPVTCLQIIAAAGFLSSILFIAEARRRAGIVILVLAGAITVALTRPLVVPLRVSQFKDLSHALRVPGARVAEERSSPLALVTVVESPTVPFRHVPGLSLSFAGEIPEQVGIFSDASGLSPITRYDGDPSSAAHLDWVSSAAPYHLRKFDRVAVVGSGGGAEVLSALAHGASNITAVELNPQVIDLVKDRYGNFAGNLYGHPRVHVQQAEARSFLAQSRTRYDLITISLVDSFSAGAAGIQGLGESYLYTVEAIDQMVGRLNPDGFLVITRWMQLPPRDVVKLLATSATALERRGMSGRSSLVLLRSWNTATLIVKHGSFTPDEISALRRFCDDRSFDLEYAPGLRREETNRYNVLQEPYLFDAAIALLESKSRHPFYQRYKFHVRPATDERPYFFHFLKWRVLPELWELRGRGGMPLIEWGYIIVVFALVQALLAALLIILLPLLLLYRRSADRPDGWVSRRVLITYFGSIGLAFLFVEIAFIQRLTLFLGHPLYAVAVVLAAFLVFAGLGSGMTRRMDVESSGRAASGVAVAALIALAAVWILIRISLPMPSYVKLILSIAVIAPLAFAMGMPFPLGLRRLAATDRHAIPWAWGINGTASVISSMGATLIAVHFGFSILVISAAALYALAGWSMGRATPLARD